jgi:hypothetical protein
MSTQSTKTARRPAKASRRTVKKSAKSARASTKKPASKSARRSAVTTTRTRPVALESRGTAIKTAPAVKPVAKSAVKAVVKPAAKPAEQPVSKAAAKASAKSVSKTVSKIAAGIAAKISSAAKMAAKEAAKDAAPKIIRTYSPPVQPAAPELPVVRHTYHVGETVYFTSPNFGRAAASGTYTVIKQLPSESDDYQYRIKSSGEAFERVAKESQLDRV